MSIEPVAWSDKENVSVCESAIEFQFPAHSTKLNESMVPLYPQSAIDELQRQLAEQQEFIDSVHIMEDMQRQLAERDDLIKNLQNAIREVFIERHK